MWWHVLGLFLCLLGIGCSNWMALRLLNRFDMMGKEFSTMTKFPATSIPAWHNARNKNFKIKFHNQNHQQVPDIHSHTIQLVPVLNLSKLQVSIDSVCVVFLNSSPSFHQWRCLRYSCRKDFSFTVVGCNYELSSSSIDPFLTRCMCTESSLNAQVRARVEWIMNKYPAFTQLYWTCALQKLKLGF